MFVEFLKCGSFSKEIIWRGNLDQIPQKGDIIIFEERGSQYTVQRSMWSILENAK